MIACTILWFLTSVLVCVCLDKKMRALQHPLRDDYVCYRALTWVTSLVALSLLFVQTEGTYFTGVVSATAGLWVAGSVWIFYFNQEVE